MLYPWFLSYLCRLTANYDRIKIPDIKDEQYSGIGRIPDVFIMLLDYVLPVINDKIKLLCKSDNKMMMLFGLQLCAGMYYEEEDYEHFCCTLDYYLCTSEEFRTNQHSHKKTRTIIIDFTTGAILTADDYSESYEVNHRKNVKPLGHIPPAVLNHAWDTLSNCNDDASNEIKERYLRTYQRLKRLFEINSMAPTKLKNTNTTDQDTRRKRAIIKQPNNARRAPYKTLSMETLIENTFFSQKMSYTRYLRCADQDATYSESKHRKIDNNVLVSCDDINTVRQAFRRST